MMTRTSFIALLLAIPGAWFGWRKAKPFNPSGWYTGEWTMFTTDAEGRRIAWDAAKKVWVKMTKTPIDPQPGCTMAIGSPLYTNRCGNPAIFKSHILGDLWDYHCDKHASNFRYRELIPMPDMREGAAKITS